MEYERYSDVELLSRIIGAKEAHRLYEGKLAPLFKARQYRGRALEKLGAAYELVKRSLLEELRRDCTMTSPDQVKNYLRAAVGSLEYESFRCLFLDTQHRLIAAEELSRGTIAAAAVYPREVMKRALAHNAAAIIFCHNHPSQTAEPSEGDRALTKTLQQALSLVDIRTLDHFVIGGANVTSFAERGWL